MLVLVRVFVVLGARLFWRSLSRKVDHAATARQLRLQLETLGGVWIKAGQLLAMRSDLFPRAFCTELSQLQDNASGFTAEDAREIVEAELGGPIEDTFSEWDALPFAAASIGQIHRARLRGRGVVVAVKVQRPYVAARVRLDLGFVRTVTRLALLLKIAPHFRWSDFYEELDRTLIEELDYRYEASAIRRMRKRLKHHRGVHAPKVFQKFSTRRVLVMEFVSGALMADLIRSLREEPARTRAWLIENRIDLERLARRLHLSLQRQIFVDNLFHGDLHPGNIILLRGSRFALIDFGAVGTLEQQFRDRYFDLEASVAAGEYAKAADLLLLMQPSLPTIDLEPLRGEIVRAFRDWELRSATKGLPYSTRSATEANGRILAAMARYRIPMSWQWLRVDRASMTLEASLRVVGPNIDYMKLSRRSIRSILEVEREAGLSRKAARGKVADGVMLAGELMKHSLEHKILEAEFMRRQARVFLPKMNKLDFLVLATVNVALTTIAVSVVLAAGVYVHQSGGGFSMSSELTQLFERVPPLPTWSWVLATVIFSLSVIQLWGLRRRFGQPVADVAGRSM